MLAFLSESEQLSGFSSDYRIERRGPRLKCVVASPVPGVGHYQSISFQRVWYAGMGENDQFRNYMFRWLIPSGV